MNSTFMDAAARVQSRLEAALGADAGSFDGAAVAGTNLPSETMVRGLLGDLFAPDDLSIVIGALNITSDVVLFSIATSSSPRPPIVGALAQMLATGYFYGQAAEAAARP